MSICQIHDLCACFMLDAGLSLRREKGGIRFSSCPPRTSSPMQEISLENNQHLTWKLVFGVQIVAELHGGRGNPFPEHYLDLKIAGKFLDIQTSTGIIWSAL